MNFENSNRFVHDSSENSYGNKTYLMYGIKSEKYIRSANLLDYINAFERSKDFFAEKILSPG